VLGGRMKNSLELAQKPHANHQTANGWAAPGQFGYSVAKSKVGGTLELGSR
jgi:hypothetical protein